MADPIRFHVDENVSSVIVAALRQRGIAVSTTAEAGLIGATDLEQLAFVQRKNRVMITHDDDFLKIANERNDHPGIAYCRKDARSIGEILERLVLIYEVLVPDEMRGEVQFL
jgi:predicted nuclease of predicted toxin-antitoxin system